MNLPSAPAKPILASDPALLDSLRSRALGRLQAVLNRSLDAADRWLFEQSQKHAKAAAPLVDAMHRLRLARLDLQGAFARHFERGFSVLRGQAALASRGGQALGLVDEEELQGLLASESTIEALERVHGPALETTALRFAAMVGAKALRPAQNPLSAPSLASALHAAQGELALPEPARIALFKNYEQELALALGELLDDLNLRMADAGILPGLYGQLPGEAEEPQGPPLSKAESLATYVPEQTPAVDDRATYDELRGLLQQRRPAVEDDAAPAEAFGGLMLPDSRRELGEDETLSLLHAMQPAPPEALQAALASGKGSLADHLKRELLGRADRGPLDAQVGLGPEYEDAVDLVGMLFDVLFGEREFEARARDLMSRLLLPYVKIAVMDRRLFQYRTHPARRLLNSIAEALEGNKGEGPQERELLNRVEGLINRLVGEFSEDITLFERLERAMRAILSQHRLRLELAERRVSELQRGQERLEKARSMAAGEVRSRSEARALPPAVLEFLQRYWAHHLAIVYLREGEHGEAWPAALDLADRLLALVPGALADPERAGKSVLALQTGVAQVLLSSGVTGQAGEEALYALASGIAKVPPASPPAAAAAASAQERAAAANDAEAEAVAADAAAREEAELQLGSDTADLMALRALRIGDWIELVGDDQRMRPVKLSWVSPISAKMMFVNRRGVRILVASVEELVLMKQQGQLALREHEQMFDHAIHRVKGRLQAEVAGMAPRAAA